MKIPYPTRSHAGHTHFWERALSRRQFMGTAAGATGLALSSGLWMPALASSGGAAPNPIPGGIDTPFGFLHFFFPGHNAEPSTITDFKGAIGVADLEGTGVGFDTDTGEEEELVWGADVRFMRGKYIGMDGRTRRGAFGFIWLDIFEDQVDPPGSDPVHQIHDFNPGTRPSGLFWTRRIRARGVRLDPENRKAELRVRVRRIGDFGDVVRALSGEDPIAIGSVAYRVRWSGGGDPIMISDGETFKAMVIEDQATLDWVAREPGFRFKSTGTTKRNFAEIGLEVNGEFFAAGEAAADEAVDDTDEVDDDGAAEVATDGDLE